MATKDRHRPGYWKERWQKQKKSGVKQKDRHRPGYYREYNLKHPERLARIGIIVGAPTGAKTQDGLEIIGYDMMNRPVTRDKLADILRNKEGQWYDDDWEED